MALTSTASHTFHVVVVCDLCRFTAQSDHSSLNAHSFALGSIEILSTPCKFGEVDIVAAQAMSDYINWNMIALTEHSSYESESA